MKNYRLRWSIDPEKSHQSKSSKGFPTNPAFFALEDSRFQLCGAERKPTIALRNAKRCMVTTISGNIQGDPAPLVAAKLCLVRSLRASRSPGSERIVLFQRSRLLDHTRRSGVFPRIRLWRRPCYLGFAHIAGFPSRG